MKKVLFIDRDGTLVIEPPSDYQLDSFEKLEFYPGVFRYLSKIASELDYELVMVTNQDGLGTASFPEDTFWPVHHLIIKSFKNEGIEFREVLIDRSFPEDNALTRKPQTGMLNRYIYGDYDLGKSYVIGDRNTDMELALNLGAKGIFIGESNEDAALSTTSWKDIYRFLKATPRTATTQRTTSETDVEIRINLDGSGQSAIRTGLNFFDHMLEQIAKHGNVDLFIEVDGDLEVDEHHTIEDVGLALGETLSKALGNKKGIERFGFVLPMDDCLAQVTIDLSGRPWLVWKADFKREMVGDMPTEMFAHFFKSLSDSMGCNLHIQAEGFNEHHKIEAIFKGFAKALNMAVTKNTRMNIPSTKGVI